MTHIKLFRLILLAFLLMLTACAPVATVPSPTTIALPSETPASLSQAPTLSAPEIPAKLVADLDTKLTNLANQNLFTGSVLIGRQGQVVLSKGYGLADRVQNIPNTSKTRFRLGSVSKQFTAMGILILESQNKLSVQDLVCKYVADCPDAWEEITIEHLLVHTAGLPDFVAQPDYQSTLATPTTPEETIARFKDLPLGFQPGERWSYSNSGYVVLGYIIEKVSGQTYGDFLQQVIFTPLNMQDTGYDHNSDTLAIGYPDMFSTTPDLYIDMSIPHAAGGLYSSVEDMFLWSEALSTEKLLPKSFLDRMFTPRASMPDGQGFSYGYGWMIGTEHGRSVVRHGGGINGFLTLITRYPTEGTVIIILSNQSQKDVGAIHTILSRELFGEK